MGFHVPNSRIAKGGAKSGRNRRNKRGNSSRNPSDIVVSSRVDRPFGETRASTTCWLKFASNVASTAGGLINSGIATTNPNGSTEFTYFAQLWDSYRVEEMVFEYVPILNLQMAANNNLSPLYVVFDPDTASSLGGSLTPYLNKQNCRIFDMTKHFTYHVKSMPRYASASTLVGAYTVYDDGFIDTATPVGIGSIQWFASGLTVTTTYGQYIVHWKVRFVSRN